VENKDRRIIKPLLSLAVTGVLAGVVCAIGWLNSALQDRVNLADLSIEDRQELIEEFLNVSSSAYSQAWYEPGIGYTLQPMTEITAWGDTFRSNGLGYRTGDVAKAENTYRVVFVGDSWTYGMGVSEKQSFPKQLEAIANQMVPMDKRIESWTLALPGYNTINEVTALEVFFERIRPDLVIICPTINDNDSTNFIHPNGNFYRPMGRIYDFFGEDHSLIYRSQTINAFKYLSRWKMCFKALRRTEDWLDAQGVPLLIFFVASWEECFVHRCMSESKIGSPYLIVLKEIHSGRWAGPPPWGHGTPECYSVYAYILYNGLAEMLGWQPLPPVSVIPEVRLHRCPPEGDWMASSNAFLANKIPIPDAFSLPVDVPHQCAGPLDPYTGLMGRATTIHLRKTEESNKIFITLRRDPEISGIYPLEVSISIPSSSGGIRKAVTVPKNGPERHRFSMQIPEDIRLSQVIEVEIRVSMVSLSPHAMILRSIYVEEITQQ
jgi:hypothetical protein